MQSTADDQPRQRRDASNTATTPQEGCLGVWELAPALPFGSLLPRTGNSSTRRSKLRRTRRKQAFALHGGSKPRTVTVQGKPPYSKNMRDWPHSPVHRLAEPGAYMVTAGTYLKEQRFASVTLLNYLCDMLLSLAEQYAWNLQAWAVFPNHYHFVALSPGDAGSLRRFTQHLHSVTAIRVNREQRSPGRTVWYEYWDSRLSHQKSYFARLSYVHRNAVHHKLVVVPSAYPWCSAGWFERKSNHAFFRTIMEFPCDRIRVPDDFEVRRIEGLV